MSDASDYPEIVPKGAKEARGIDFCGTNKYYYIIRSDLGVYMRSTDFHEGKDLQIYTLSEACRWGDHYLAAELTSGTYYYIIKGDQYHRTTNMNEDKDGQTFHLHEHCQGGSFYYSVDGKYYIVFTDRGKYRRVKNMNTDEDPHEFDIHEAFHDGIYFWGLNDIMDPYPSSSRVYCLKQAGKWGVSYHRSTNMNTNSDAATFSVHESVLNFLPAGIAQTHGKAFGKWQLVKSFDNDSDNKVHWERKIERTVGFKKSEMSSIENDWSINAGVQTSSGLLTAAICKYQFSLDATYGGKKVNTDQEDWSEASTETETLQLDIPANSSMFLWQYQMGFGDTPPSLFCVNEELNDDPEAPVDPPMSG